MTTPLLKIGQIFIWQMSQVMLHILLCQDDKHITDGVSYAARAAVQHHPDALLLIEANFNKVVSGTQRAQMLVVVGFQQLRVFIRELF